MVLTFVSEGEGRGGLREVDPGRDLGIVAALIAEGFAGEMDPRAEASLREMRRLARLWPLIGWLAEADPILRESLGGFLWEEPVPGKKGLQAVANATLNTAPGARGWAILCNVITRPEYRRQGIARQLTMAAIGAARERGAEGILLQVYDTNQAARRLYASLGFRETAGEADLRLERAAGASVTDAPDYDIRRLRLSDGHAALELVRDATPEPLQWMLPVRPVDYEPDVLTAADLWLSDRLAGRHTRRLAAFQGERLAGLLVLRTARRGPAHHLQIYVADQDRGRIEKALVAEALRCLAARPTLPVGATVFQDHIEAVEALRAHGFELRRTLLVMKKVLR